MTVTGVRGPTCQPEGSPRRFTVARGLLCVSLLPKMEIEVVVPDPIVGAGGQGHYRSGENRRTRSATGGDLRDPGVRGELQDPDWRGENSSKAASFWKTWPGGQVLDDEDFRPCG